MRKLFLGFGIILVIILCLSFFLIKVRLVSCKTEENGPCPVEITELLQGFVGKRLIGSAAPIQSALLNQSQIKAFSVKISPFGDISTTITLRQADIALKPESADVYTLYTKDGIVVRESSETSLPIITLKEQLASQNVPFVVTLGWQLTTILPTKEMSVEGSSLKVVLRDDRLVYYPLSGDIDLLLGSTLATFSQLNLTDGKLIIDRKATTIHEIDLRFKNPVLR